MAGGRSRDVQAVEHGVVDLLAPSLRIAEYPRPTGVGATANAGTVAPIAGLFASR
jgi:hypothetical protein